MRRASFGRLSAIVIGLVTSVACKSADRLHMPRDMDDPWMFGRETPPVEPSEDTVVFAAVGDVGAPRAPQAAVARGVERACGERCDFVVLLGDNLYEDGVDSRRDIEMLSCIVGRYPTDEKYMVLGNHDYIVENPSLRQARRQLSWIRLDESKDDEGVGASGRYHFYRFRAGPARLVALDTNFLVRGTIDVRYIDLARWMGSMRPRGNEWVIAFGHHAIVSNGSHGDAGSFRDGGLKIWPGRFFRFFVERHLLGRADLYIAGHDHNLQFFPSVHGTFTAQVLSGSGARCGGRSARAEDGRAMMERYGHGFAIIEARPDRLAVSFHDYEGRRFWGAWRTRSDPTWRALGGFPARSVDTRNHCRAEAQIMLAKQASDRIDPCAE